MVLTDREAEEIAERIATAYPLTVREAFHYVVITQREDIATEAGKARGDGWPHRPVQDALLYSEATTAEGIAHWIRHRSRG